LADWYSWVGKVLDVDLTSEKITKIPSDRYFPNFLGGRGLEAKVIWDDVPEGTKALDPENRLIFAPSSLTGTNSPMNGRWNIGALAPSHPDEYPSSSAIGGHWGAELKFAGYDGVIVHGKASRPVYLLIRDEEVEIRSASNYWGLDAIEGQKKLAADIAAERSFPDMAEKPEAGRYNPINIRTVMIGPAGENSSRIACIMHDSGDSAGQGGFGGVMGSKNLKAISVRGSGAVKAKDPQRMMEVIYKIRRMIRHEARVVIPPFGGPGGLYGGDPSILTGYVKRADGCFGCQVGCRGFFDVPGSPPGQAQCVQLQMYNNWEGVGPVAPPHPDFSNRQQDETTWYGIRLADELGINAYELTGILSWLWACWKEKIFGSTQAEFEENTGIPNIEDMGSKEFADNLFGMIANREGEFGNLLADGLYRAAKQLKEKFGNRVWELYEERYVASGSRQHWFYIGTARGPADPTGYANPIGQLMWAIGSRDPYSNCSFTREPYAKPDIAKSIYGNEESANPFTYDGKAQAASIAYTRGCMNDSIGFCDWFFPILTVEPFFKEEGEEEEGRHLGDLTVEAQVFSAATGIEKTIDQLMEDSYRVVNLERAIMVRMGRRRENDTFSNFFFNNPDRRGNPIDRVAWEKVKDDFYSYMGWDPKTGIPTRARLESLDLKDVADTLGV
jgi:aldehyde:ferredoxin oxidoreductase|tara:strand:- start:1462 stop:3477 length:2016 start_codon:yes stop_codon:yes gene_type:complete